MSDSDEFEDQQEFFFGEYDGERNEAGERSVFLIFRKMMLTRSCQIIDSSSILSLKSILRLTKETHFYIIINA